MSEREELLARLDSDAKYGPGDGLPSILDIVAADCKDAAAALRSDAAKIAELEMKVKAYTTASKDKTDWCPCCKQGWNAAKDLLAERKEQRAGLAIAKAKA